MTDLRKHQDWLRTVLEEDLAGGVDVTSYATIPAGARATGDFVARAHGVVAGLELAALAMDLTGATETALVAADGDTVAPGDVLATVSGPTRSLLTGERTALNVVSQLSGVATATRRWSEALDGTECSVRDTRKTVPLMRSLQKYAVRCGGGVNHRMALSDAALIKDNHVIAAGGVVAAYKAVREAYPDLEVQVEADTYEQAIAAVEAGAELLLLDNMAPEELRRVVDAVGGRARLEASGGLTLADAAAVAATGVDYIAVGALTHSAEVFDIGFDLRSA